MSGIVVGVDLSEQSAEALRWAVRESQVRGEPLTAVLAWSQLEQHIRQVSGGFDPGCAQRELRSFVLDTVGADRAADITCRVVCDLPVAGLRSAAAGAGLLVLGARGLGGFKELLVGSVSQQTVHHASCPVAIIRADPAARAAADGGRVVVGVDDSAPARAALGWAAEEARARGVTLEVVHAWSVPYVSPFVPVDLDLTAPEDGARRFLDRVIAAAVPRPEGLEIVRTVVNGAPAPSILARAQGAELVVVGSRGRGGFAGLLLGSTTHQLTHHAVGPIVVVPASHWSAP